MMLFEAYQCRAIARALGGHARVMATGGSWDLLISSYPRPQTKPQSNQSAAPSYLPQPPTILIKFATKLRTRHRACAENKSNKSRTEHGHQKYMAKTRSTSKQQITKPTPKNPAEILHKSSNLIILKDMFKFFDNISCVMCHLN